MDNGDRVVIAAIARALAGDNERLGCSDAVALQKNPPRLGEPKFVLINHSDFE